MEADNENTRQHFDTVSISNKKASKAKLVKIKYVGLQLFCHETVT